MILTAQMSCPKRIQFYSCFNTSLMKGSQVVAKLLIPTNETHIKYTCIKQRFYIDPAQTWSKDTTGIQHHTTQSFGAVGFLCGLITGVSVI